MRICFVNSEIFSHKGGGGYAGLNRIIGDELIKRGIEVYVLVPHQKGLRKVSQLDGMIVLTFPYPSIKTLFSQSLFRLPEADIYDIWDPDILFSYFITRATPKSKHVVAFHDPRGPEEFKKLVSADPGLKNLRRNNNLKVPYLPYYLYLIYLRPYLAKKTVSKADAYFYTAKFMIPKVKRIYNLEADKLIFMPHIVEIPKKKSVKSSQPTVCFLGRWDAVKRPELFFELARHFPEVRFIAIGAARDLEKDKQLRKIGSKIPNLEMPGHVDEATKEEILEKSWILANTSIHEGFPLSFLEACSYRCALLSGVNPDDFAQNFGYHVQNDNFEVGLEYLLENNRWKEKGERGFEYVKETNELNKVIDKRIEVYESLLGRR